MKSSSSNGGDIAATVYHVGGMDIVLEGTNTVSGVEEANSCHIYADDSGAITIGPESGGKLIKVNAGNDANAPGINGSPFAAKTAIKDSVKNKNTSTAKPSTLLSSTRQMQEQAIEKIGRFMAQVMAGRHQKASESR